ncbi:P-loop containing nucleoside triphosphate hydrolase protein [Chaetomium tenue]|uniref:P-loop containing nucleoside triphosphate hydrolase protein n=1 Tax=Chaetomium tenue TaxID=1854479 RepID=A0ACB7P842_9PEZI|nr:P-loop containing nucleoside triphosphate hydrolase protein [Chaetomium globosum]
MVAFESNTLSRLCSQGQLELLDSVDQLRLQGINNYVSLPQIIVCGDQSSGKSSVLEAISGVSFPVSGNLCTRFPTELVLRRTPTISASVSIVPHDSRSESEQLSLRGFRERLDGFAGLPRLVESAKLAMGITTHGKAFAKDILRIEITGPDRPHLTIVDLPGLIHSATRYQSGSDVELIRDVVQGYMKQPRCIILAVVSAKNDFANQVVLKLARAVDKSGTRTLGVITKPDDLTPGSEREALYLSLARNQEVDFRLGWHVLKNMDSEKGSWTLAERDTEEAAFLSKGAWTALPLAHLGIDKLRGRLSKVLLAQIASELPGLMSEIEQKFKSCQIQLDKLGEPRASLDEQRVYLFHLSQSFQTLVKASTGGSYIGKFFEDALSEAGYQQRIRAVVQNLNQSFASDLVNFGHYRHITEGRTPDQPLRPESITRDDFISHVENLMSRTRGRELPGTFNSMVVADLFVEQSQPWASIAREHIDKVWTAARDFVNLVVDYIADKSTAGSLKQEIFQPAMKELRSRMHAKTTELLLPHQAGHPVTYNPDFTETLQKVRLGRSSKDPEEALRDFFGVRDLKSTYLSGHYDLSRLVASLAVISESAMTRPAAMEAMDCLDAYYKVALKRFMDDVAVEVIEAKLVSAIDDIFSPVKVYQMSPELVSRIAGESEDSRTEREQLSRQLAVLGNGLLTCKRFAGFRVGGGESSCLYGFSSLPRSNYLQSLFLFPPE